MARKYCVLFSDAFSSLMMSSCRLVCVCIRVRVQRLLVANFYEHVGVFLRKLESGLQGISHVVIDEIHERDINVSMVMY